MRIEPAGVILHLTIIPFESNSIDSKKFLTSIFFIFGSRVMILDFFLVIRRRTSRLSLANKFLIVAFNLSLRNSFRTANTYVAEQGRNDVFAATTFTESSSKPIGNCALILLSICVFMYSSCRAVLFGIRIHSISSSEATPTGLGSGNDNLGRGLKP